MLYYSSGTTYRRTVLMEHDLGLQLKHYKLDNVLNDHISLKVTYFSPKTRSVVMLVDTSYPESRGHQLYQSFVFHQEKPSTALIKRLLIQSILTAAPSDPEVDNSDIVNKLSVRHITTVQILYTTSNNISYAVFMYSTCAPFIYVILFCL